MLLLVTALMDHQCMWPGCTWERRTTKTEVREGNFSFLSDFRSCISSTSVTRCPVHTWLGHLIRKHESRSAAAAWRSQPQTHGALSEKFPLTPLRESQRKLTPALFATAAESPHCLPVRSHSASLNPLWNGEMTVRRLRRWIYIPAARSLCLWRPLWSPGRVGEQKIHRAERRIKQRCRSGLGFKQELSREQSEVYCWWNIIKPEAPVQQMTSNEEI